jgi:Leucine-rich repeat (LRR) protein
VLLCFVIILQELKLDGNRLEFIPSLSLNGPESLRKLSLKNNRIGITYTFRRKEIYQLNFYNLLFLFSDSIQQGSFLSQKSLLVIDLTSNRINNVEIGAFEGLSVLKQLLLSENRLSKFNSDIFSGNI